LKALRLYDDKNVFNLQTRSNQINLQLLSTVRLGRVVTQETILGTERQRSLKS